MYSKRYDEHGVQENVTTQTHNTHYMCVYTHIHTFTLNYNYKHDYYWLLPPMAGYALFANMLGESAHFHLAPSCIVLYCISEK